MILEELNYIPSHVSKRVSLRFKGVLLYTIGVLFHVEWCIKQL